MEKAPVAQPQFPGGVGGGLPGGGALPGGAGGSTAGFPSFFGGQGLGGQVLGGQGFDPSKFQQFLQLFKQFYSKFQNGGGFGAGGDQNTATPEDANQTPSTGDKTPGGTGTESTGKGA
ncbi:hypothetical protein EJ03DRAFT_324825 [Teratosphaeria nubilosa]|uniref:Uncharacterized protein n=1 Tax=Teratosphaeria nubilosa TaxID=161662 RepID=A0A6G1LHH9_9PEZI|nr:hypothetical protein EJ03DRAFT_324825 [Teratosphaeria nubilosa]